MSQVTSNGPSPRLPYQQRSVRKEELYARFRLGEITVEDLAQRVDEIDRPHRILQRAFRVLVGALLPMLFVRPSR